MLVLWAILLLSLLRSDSFSWCKMLTEDAFVRALDDMENGMHRGICIIIQTFSPSCTGTASI